MYPMGFRAALGTPLARKSPWQCERYAHMRAHVCGCFVLLPTQQKSAVQESRNTSISTIIKCCCKYDFISLAETQKKMVQCGFGPHLLSLYGEKTVETFLNL